jgi:hypothetical protein
MTKSSRNKLRMTLVGLILSVPLSVPAAICTTVPSPYGWWAPWPFEMWPIWFPDLWEPRKIPAIDRPPIIAPGPGRRCDERVDM